MRHKPATVGPLFATIFCRECDETIKIKPDIFALRLACPKNTRKLVECSDVIDAHDLELRARLLVIDNVVASWGITGEGLL